MIPRLDQLQGVSRLHAEFLDALPAAGFGGEIRRDAASRLVTSTDNSVYQLLPQAVVFPRSTEDVAVVLRVAAEPRFRGVTLAPRGGGTGTNGQALTEGVVLDVSKYLDRILEVDLAAGWVRVQPGVVLDQLNAHLAPHGVFFAPNLSPSSRATIGGMIATDACGQGSRIYGRTSEHLVELTVALLGGEVFTSRALAPEALAECRQRTDRVGEVYRVVDEVVTRQRDLIRETFPRLRRFMTGYNLARIRDEAPDTCELRTFDLNALIAGAEGTLGVVTEAKLRLTPLPRHKRLVVLKFASFDDALASAEQVVATDPGAIETIDDTIVRLARGDIQWHRVGPMIGDDPALAALNLVEYWGDDPTEVEARARALVEDVSLTLGQSGKAIGLYVAKDNREAAALWNLRKSGVGLLGNAPGARKPVPFVEDTVVPPANLAAYVADFRALLDAEGLSYGMFGHVDVGCLHVRPALDLKDPADERRLRAISDRVVELVQKYGGMLWGEHGKGFRSEYNPVFFGEALFGELCRVKRAFDPHNQLNPGKLAVPAGSDARLVTVEAPTRGQRDRQIPPPVRERFALSIDCNGNGACFHYDPDYVMCPSAKVTRDRVHSPKGRAGVMREWLRQLAAAGHDPLAERRGNLLRRAWNTLQRRRGTYDYSNEVHAAMAGCLACKACATQCPVQVDVPSFRSEFLELYHTRYLRPLKDHFVAALERMLALLGRAPRLSNALSHNPLSLWMVRKVVGMVDVPRLSTGSVDAGLAARGAPKFDLERVRGLDPAARASTVALLQDAFTRYYEPEVLLAAHDALTRLGFRVEVLPYLPSGKGHHVKGLLRGFRRQATRNVRYLEQVAATGVPLVGLEPAVVLLYRDEIPKALGTAPGFSVHLLQEWLMTQRDRFHKTAEQGSYRLFAHCTERTAQPAAEDQWRAIFAAAGLTLEPAAVGCCGMCGAYGHEVEHVAESKGIFAMSWARHLPAHASTALATGYSCRSQTKRIAGFRPRHPIEVLAEALAQR